MRRETKIDWKKLKLSVQNKRLVGSEPILVQVFVQRESTDAVPVDQIILYPNKEIPVLMLPKGNFRIRAIDRIGRSAAENYFLTVK
jgi:hypothetical protein